MYKLIFLAIILLKKEIIYPITLVHQIKDQHRIANIYHIPTLYHDHQTDHYSTFLLC
jgi:hypothetical protein